MSKDYVKFYLDTEIKPYAIVDADNGDDYPIEDEGIFETVVKKLNELNDKNENLKSILRNFYYDELCEICLYSKYMACYCPDYGVYEHDMNCLKGHKNKGGIYEYEEVSECADFKLDENFSPHYLDKQLTACNNANRELFFNNKKLENKFIKENNQLKEDAKTALLIIKAIWPLPFKISIDEAESLKRLSENVGELLNTEGD